MSKQIGKIQSMLEWLRENGGHVHPSTELRNDPEFGPSLFASSDIPPNEAVISCPIDLVITPFSATASICELLNIHEDDLVWPVGSSSSGKSWNERMRICVYLCLHWIYVQDRRVDWNDLPPALRHWPYIACLPPFDSLRTPLWMTDEEFALLEGTNLSGASRDRKKEWMEEEQAVRSLNGLEGVTWERYLAAATYLSSRAFPSSLLRKQGAGDSFDPRGSSSLPQEQEEESHPVLIPGLDLLNHNPEAPVLWRSTTSVSSQPIAKHAVSIESSVSIEAGSQIWNNYGPRSNEELLLGYGFTIPNNPHDTVVLKLGSAAVPTEKLQRLEKAGLDAGKRYHLRRDGVIDQELLQVLRILLSDPDFAEHHHHGDEEDDVEEDEHAQMEKEQREIELELDVLGMLGGMLDDKLAKVDVEPDVTSARPAVREMCQIYREGQRDILASTLDKLSDRLDQLEKMLDSGMTCSCCT